MMSFGEYFQQSKNSVQWENQELQFQQPVRMSQCEHMTEVE